MSETKQPWSVEGIMRLLRFGRKMAGSWDDVEEVENGTERIPDENDAVLIASAPDLLAENEELAEALERIERVAGLPMMEDDPARTAARAVLAKRKERSHE